MFEFIADHWLAFLGIWFGLSVVFSLLLGRACAMNRHDDEVAERIATQNSPGGYEGFRAALDEVKAIRDLAQDQVLIGKAAREQLPQYEILIQRGEEVLAALEEITPSKRSEIK